MLARRPGEDTTPDVTWLPVDLRGMAGQPKPQNSFNMPDQPAPGARFDVLTRFALKTLSMSPRASSRCKRLLVLHQQRTYICVHPRIATQQCSCLQAYDRQRHCFLPMLLLFDWPTLTSAINLLDSSVVPGVMAPSIELGASLAEDVEAKLGHFQRSYSTPLTAAASSDSLGSAKERQSPGARQLPVRFDIRAGQALLGMRVPNS